MKRILPIIIVNVLALILLVPPFVKAQVVLPLTVAPARQQLTVDPGEKTAVNIKFFNRSDSPISGSLKVADFVVEDKEGTPVFLEELEGAPIITGKSKISSRFAAASWVQLPYEKMTIGPQDGVLVQTKINVPIDARSGGRYVAVYFETGGTPGEATGQGREAAVPTTTRLAGLVYLRVSGPITEQALLSRFTAPSFQEYGPVKFESEILNRGDYHIRPRGVVTVTDFLGRLVDQAVLDERNIFPDASRVFENEIGSKWMFGRFKATFGASFGEKGKGITGNLYFWVFPWRVALVVVLALLILLILFYNLQARSRLKMATLEKKLEKEEKELKELKEELKKKESD